MTPFRRVSRPRKPLGVALAVLLVIMAQLFSIPAPGVLGVVSAGDAFAWGNNAAGQLGDGTLDNHSAPIPVSGLSRVIGVGAGFEFSAALRSDGTVWTWGGNKSGQLGNGVQGIGSAFYRLTPGQVLGLGGAGFLTGVAQIAVGFDWVVALMSDGTVWSWGDNFYGQQGDGTNTDRLTPDRVAGPGGVGFLTDVIAIAAGHCQNYALKRDGTVWAWGRNDNGELGQGFLDPILNRPSTPVQVQGPGGVGFLTGVVTIGAGGHNGMAQKSDGTLWTWGDNMAGQLGDGTTTTVATPVQVKGPGGVGFLTGAIALEGGEHHSLALRSDGTVWTWGDNMHGQLGDGTLAMRITPVQVVGLGGVGFLTGVSAIHGGDHGSMAVKSDGTLLVWGGNEVGELGNGTAGIDSPTPLQPIGPGGAGFLTGVLPQMSAVALGHHHSLAVVGAAP